MKHNNKKEGNNEKNRLKLQKKSWLWLFVQNQQLLSILNISHSNNIDVAIMVISKALVKFSPATFWHIVAGVKFFFKQAVDSWQRICCIIRCMFDECCQHIRVGCVEDCILPNLINVCARTVLRPHEKHLQTTKAKKRLCWIFNGFFWQRKEWMVCTIWTTSQCVC